MDILIVEDEKPLANALFAKCVTAGMNPTLAANGREALASAKEAHPDVILLDLMMPEMNGMEFMHELRQDPWGKTVPIIILTNLSADSKELVAAVVEGSPEYYLIKSDWKIDDIIGKIEEVYQDAHS